MAISNETSIKELFSERKFTNMMKVGLGAFVAIVLVVGYFILFPKLHDVHYIGTYNGEAYFYAEINKNSYSSSDDIVEIYKYNKDGKFKKDKDLKDVRQNYDLIIPDEYLQYNNKISNVILDDYQVLIEGNKMISIMEADRFDDDGLFVVAVLYYDLDDYSYEEEVYYFSDYDLNAIASYVNISTHIEYSVGDNGKLQLFYSFIEENVGTTYNNHIFYLENEEVTHLDTYEAVSKDKQLESNFDGESLYNIRYNFVNEKNAIENLDINVYNKDSTTEEFNLETDNEITDVCFTEQYDYLFTNVYNSDDEYVKTQLEAFDKETHLGVFQEDVSSVGLQCANNKLYILNVNNSFADTIVNDFEYDLITFNDDGYNVRDINPEYYDTGITRSTRTGRRYSTYKVRLSDGKKASIAQISNNSIFIMNYQSADYDDPKMRVSVYDLEGNEVVNNQKFKLSDQYIELYPNYSIYRIYEE